MLLSSPPGRFHQEESDLFNLFSESDFVSYSSFPSRRRQWHPTPVLLPGKSHGQRSLVGCSPWGRKELDTTEQLNFLFSLSCFGEGNGNPLQCSCLENPRDSRPWWATTCGVAQSLTQLKRLSSNSSSFLPLITGHTHAGFLLPHPFQGGQRHFSGLGPEAWGRAVFCRPQGDIALPTRLKSQL